MRLQPLDVVRSLVTWDTTTGHDMRYNDVALVVASLEQFKHNTRYSFLVLGDRARMIDLWVPEMGNGFEVLL